MPSPREPAAHRVPKLRGAAFTSGDGTGAGEERSDEQDRKHQRAQSELERLIAELSESGQLIFVFGIGWWTAHLTGAATPVFRGPADRRRWHVVLGDDAASGTMDMRVDEITGIRFAAALSG